MRRSPRRAARPAALLAIAAVALTAGCGGDDDEEERPAETTPAVSVPDPVTTPPPETTMDEDRAEGDEEPRTPPPEEQQGDEEPIRSEAVFTGRDGELRPRRVQVPAFIAIRVILRSGDGARYSLRIGGTRLTVGGGQRTAELELDGLLPDERYDGTSPQGKVRVVASAEPGP